jgi:putative DNA primase/helicase
LSIEGYGRLKERGSFEQPQRARDAIETLHDLASPHKAFVADRYVNNPRESVVARDLYNEWKDWCRESGKDPGKYAVFCRDMHTAFPNLNVTQPRQKDGTRPRVYESIGIAR